MSLPLALALVGMLVGLLAYCDVSVNGLLEDYKQTGGLIQPNVSPQLQEVSIYICGHYIQMNGVGNQLSNYTFYNYVTS